MYIKRLGSPADVILNMMDLEFDCFVIDVITLLLEKYELIGPVCVRFPGLQQNPCEEIGFIILMCINMWTQTMGFGTTAQASPPPNFIRFLKLASRRAITFAILPSF